MKTKLNWEKGILNSTYEIYSDGHFIGNLRSKFWTQSADGEFNGKKYSFLTKGVFNQETQIFDIDNNIIIGNINYNFWMTKARIEFKNRVINWNYDNFWSTKWSIFDSKGLEIKYSGSSIKGEIDSNTDDELILLIGLYVTNYYWQIYLIIMIVIFIPIWAALLK